MTTTATATVIPADLVPVLTNRVNEVDKFVRKCDRWFRLCDALSAASRRAETDPDFAPANRATWPAEYAAAVAAWERGSMPSKRSKGWAYDAAYVIAARLDLPRCSSVDDLRNLVAAARNAGLR